MCLPAKTRRRFLSVRTYMESRYSGRSLSFFVSAWEYELITCAVTAERPKKATKERLKSNNIHNSLDFTRTQREMPGEYVSASSGPKQTDSQSRRAG